MTLATFGSLGFNIQSFGFGSLRLRGLGPSSSETGGSNVNHNILYFK